MLGAMLCTGSVAHTDGSLPPWSTARDAFKARLKSKNAGEKARAFESLRGRPEAEALKELLNGYRKVRAEGDKIGNAQERAEREYEKLLDKLDAIRRKFEESQRSERDMEAFNKAERKLSKQLDEARTAARAFENHWWANRALLDSATDVAASILRKLPDEDLETALLDLRSLWLEGKDPEGPMRWMDTLAPVARPAVTKELHVALGNPDVALTSRVAALNALAGRRDGLVLERAFSFLELATSEFLLVAAAIAAIQLMHDRRGIAPMIDFLKRDNLGRLRDDAREALVSMTGQTHGPYFEPWSAWWTDAEESFQMPPDPCPTPTVVPEDKSKTFYGIHTFSNRLLYIVDVSASMNWAPGKRGRPGGDDAKIVTLREELSGAVNGLDDGAYFNVIVFNHSVVPWSARSVVHANDTTKKKLSRWINEIKPVGLTNIHDALEAGFRLILRGTGTPDFDTIFFLTDGKPTGGKVTDPERILEAVRDWNSVANARIHVIGIGHGKDVDELFLQKLAEIGRGKYVQREK